MVNFRYAIEGNCRGMRTRQNAPQLVKREARSAAHFLIAGPCRSQDETGLGFPSRHGNSHEPIPATEAGVGEKIIRPCDCIPPNS